MNFNIIMKDEVYDEIHTLMNNIKTLNAGEEIGAWLTGEWTHTETESTLKLDKFVIPEQEVSKTEVDISPESMIDTIKELGSEESNRIKAHWHIHPFGKGVTNWSSIDESKIGDFMSPEKQREIFVFLLSSEDRVKARVEVRIKGKLSFKQEEFVFSETYDNLPVTKESNLGDNAYLERLKERIKEKVKKITYTPKVNTAYGYGKPLNKVGAGNNYPKQKPFLISRENNVLKVSVCDKYLNGYSFSDHLAVEPSVSNELREYSKSFEDRANERVVFIYKFADNKEACDNQEFFTEELKMLYEEYEDILITMGEEVMDYNQSYLV